MERETGAAGTVQEVVMMETEAVEVMEAAETGEAAARRAEAAGMRHFS